MSSDSGEDSDETDAVSEQLSGSFINDGEYTQSPGHEQDIAGNGETQQLLHYAVDNAREEEDSPGLCRCASSCCCSCSCVAILSSYPYLPSLLKSTPRLQTSHHQLPQHV